MGVFYLARNLPRTASGCGGGSFLIVKRASFVSTPGVDVATGAACRMVVTGGSIAGRDSMACTETS